MKKLLFLVAMLVATTVVSSAQTTVKTYQRAYLANKEDAVKVAREQQLNHKNINIEIFMIEYPVLDEIKNFKKKEKYSLINDALIETVVVPDHGKYILFLLKGGYEYKVKKKRQVGKVFCLLI